MAKSRVVSIPAPVGGWNARDSLAAMDPRDAPIMDNFFPDTTVVRLRGGSDAFATGVGSGTSAVESLIAYANGLTSNLLAAANNSLFQVTTSGSVSTLGTGFGNNRWQAVGNF